jgi:hypothetical protein
MSNKEHCSICGHGKYSKYCAKMHIDDTWEHTGQACIPFLKKEIEDVKQESDLFLDDISRSAREVYRKDKALDEILALSETIRILACNVRDPNSHTDPENIKTAEAILLILHTIEKVSSDARQEKYT